MASSDEAERRELLTLSERMVFLVGAQRSGTTWLHRLLASHPRIQTGEESDLFSKYVGPQVRAWRMQVEKELSEDTATGRELGLPCYLTEAQFLRAVSRYLLDLLRHMTRQLGPADLFLEKTPDHAKFIPEIKLLLPRAKIIHIIRDPRDVAASMLAASRGWGKAWAPDDALTAATTWKSVVTQTRTAGSRLPGDEFKEIRYEALLASPVDELTEISAFLGVPWDVSAIEAAVSANRLERVRRGGGTPIGLGGELGRRAGQVAKYPSDFTRAASPGGWKSDLSFKEKVQVWRRVRGTLEQFGYSWPLRDWLRSS